MSADCFNGLNIENNKNNIPPLYCAEGKENDTENVLSEVKDDGSEERFLPLEVSPDRVHRLIHPNGESWDADSVCWGCFQDALAYAEQAQRRSEYIKAAQKLGMTPLELAARDFFTPPEISRINLNNYNGCRGDLIEVTAFDTVKVCQVGILIVDEQYNLLEFGYASHAKGNIWVYESSKYYKLSSVIVIADVTDLPGHLSEKRTGKKLKRGRSR
ncbi:MAG: hypothetical protein ACI38Q_00065 [Candidatus Bruticola sp.]